MSDLTDLLESIRDAANEIGEMVQYKDLPDPSTLYVEPSIDNSPLSRRGPSIVLGCRDHGVLIHFAWGGGGRVVVTDLLAQVREHLDSHHG